MPGSIIGELILQPIVEVVLQFIGYFTGRVVVPVLSFGRAYISPAPRGVPVWPRWHGFNRSSDGHIVLDCEMGAFFGVIFWLVVGVAGYFIYRYVGA